MYIGAGGQSSQFVNVSQETLILDQYTNTPSYKIGFNVLEEIVTADLDETLNDNSQGFNNYSAPLRLIWFLFVILLIDVDYFT